ncbi:MAG: hypothetical protein HY017_32295 [Betaproteobacteria bacterium]|nr:hypothetical protein [Betaproteobacteria bacterium]
MTVPAGTFHAFKLLGVGRRSDTSIEYEIRRWYVPEFQRPVVREEKRWQYRRLIYTQRLELVSYKLA